MNLPNRIFHHSVFAVVLLLLTGCPGMPKMGGRGPGDGPGGGGGGCPQCNPKPKGGRPSASRVPGEGQPGNATHGGAPGLPGNGNAPGVGNGSQLGNGLGDNGPASSAPGLGGNNVLGLDGANGSLVPPGGPESPNGNATTGTEGTADAPFIPLDSKPAEVKVMDLAEPLKPCSESNSPLATWASGANDGTAKELLTALDGGKTQGNPLAEEISSLLVRLAAQRGVDFTLRPTEDPDFQLLMGRAKAQVLRCLVDKEKSEALKSLLDARWDPNFRDGNGNTALGLAVANGSAGLVSILLGRDLTPEARAKRVPVLPNNSEPDKNEIRTAIVKLNTPLVGAGADKSKEQRALVLKTLAEHQFTGDGKSRFDAQVGAIAVTEIRNLTEAPSKEQLEAVKAVLLAMEPAARPSDLKVEAYKQLVGEIASVPRQAPLGAVPAANSVLAPEKYGVKP